MSIEQFEKKIYLLYGEERYLLENYLRNILKKFGEKTIGINYIKLDNTNVINIIQDIETPSFGYDSKIVVIQNSGLFKKTTKKKNNEKKESENELKNKEDKLEDKIAKYISENIDNINKSVLLVFVETEVEKNKLYKEIEKNGKVINFAKLQTSEISEKIKSICSAYKVKIDNKTVRYFIENCGTNMQDLINEIRKQIEYVGTNGTITEQNIDVLAIKQLDSVIFDLTDNLGKKNTKKALEIFYNMLYEKEPIQKILIILYNHFKKLYITTLSLKEGKDLAQTLNLKPNQLFLKSKYTMQSKYFTENELRKILEELTDLDYKSKTGNIDIKIGLESIICKYC